MSNRKSNSSVKILKELFPHWNDDDLNQVLIDVSGDLESAVARISEGHASQFSTVQSKKEKKATPAQPTPSLPSVKSDNQKQRSAPTRGRANSSRGQPATRGSFNPPRGPRGGSARTSNRQATKPKDQSASNSATPAKWSDNKPSTSSDAPTSATTTQSKQSSASKSWAQIAKPPSPKPAPIAQVEPKPAPVPTKAAEESTNEKAMEVSQPPPENIAWDVTAPGPAPTAPPSSAWNKNESAWTSNSADSNASAWISKENAWEDKPSAPKSEEDSKPSQPSTQSSAPPGFGAPKPNSRAAQRARQDAAVVMPSPGDNKSFGNAIGVQFGSLSLLDNPAAYEEQQEQPKAAQQAQESIAVPQAEPVASAQPASQPAQQQAAPQQPDISAYTASSQQPQQDVYGQYFQQSQQQPATQQAQQAQADVTQPQPQQPQQPQQQQPITSQGIPPQFQQYNQAITPTPDAYSNVFSNLAAQPNQLSGGAFGQQTQNDYAALYNDQAQRDFALQQANYYGQQQQQQQQPSSFGRQIGQEDSSKSVPTPSINQATTPSISSQQQTASGYPGITAPMPYYFNPYAAAYGAPNAAAFYGQAAAASPYNQFPKYPMYPAGPAQPSAGFQQPAQPKPSNAAQTGNGATAATSSQSPYVQHSTATNVASPSPYQSYDPSTAYDSFLNQTINNAGSPAISHQDKHQSKPQHQNPQQQHPQHPQQQPYNAFGSAYQAPPLFQTPSFSHYQGYGGWQAQQRYGQGYP